MNSNQATACREFVGKCLDAEVQISKLIDAIANNPPGNGAWCDFWGEHLIEVEKKIVEMRRGCQAFAERME
jgi:hypothetical protein